MRNTLPALLLMAATTTAPALLAQDAPAKLELYAGYDYVRFNINANVAGQPPSQTFNANGGGRELTYSVNNWLGLLDDMGGYWATNSTSQGAALPYLFGPRVNLHHWSITPFAQVLLGSVLTSFGIVQTGWQSHFAMTVGGGIDIKLASHFSLRPLQAEYFLTKIPDGLHNRDRRPPR